MLFVGYRRAVGGASGRFWGVESAVSVFGSAVSVVSGVDSALSRGFWIGSAVSLLVVPDSGENATPSALPIRKPPAPALPMVADTQIAAICLAREASCATRNVKDFDHTGKGIASIGISCCRRGSR